MSARAALVATLAAAAASAAQAAPRPATIAGVVTDAATGEPMPGVPVASGAALAFTDEAGRYQLTVAPGPVVITIAADYLRTTTAALTVAPGEARALDLVVELDLGGGEQVVIEDRAPVAAWIGLDGDVGGWIVTAGAPATR